MPGMHITSNYDLIPEHRRLLARIKAATGWVPVRTNQRKNGPLGYGFIHSMFDIPSDSGALIKVVHDLFIDMIAIEILRGGKLSVSRCQMGLHDYTLNNGETHPRSYLIDKGRSFNMLKWVL